MTEATSFPSQIDMTDDLDADRLREYCGVFGVFGLHAVLWLPRGFKARRQGKGHA